MAAPDAYEDVVEGLQRYVSTLRPRGAEVFRFPPVVNRALIEKSGYLKSFPHLLGCVCALGTDVKRVNEAVARYEAGGSWTDTAEAERTRAGAGGVLSDLPDRGAARRHQPGFAVRRRLRLFPPRAFEGHRPAAIVPHARVRRHRRA